jgi:ABC-type polar amino acid transport system ATPase subunit
MAECDRVTRIVLSDVHKRYGRTEVLKGIDLHIASGATLAILGQSGSGKTTLIRCINALESIQTGNIKVGNVMILPSHLEQDGRRLSKSHVAHYRSKCGMVFQGFHLFPHMTVLQNLIEAPVGIRREDRMEAIGRAETLLADIGLSEKTLEYPSSLSGGQQQRVAIARALMMAPEVLLFDEPTSALDPMTTVEVLSLIRRLSTGDRTTIIVTHEIEFARHVSTHVAFMKDGLVEEYRPTGEFFADPRSPATRAFLSQFATPKGNHHADL